MKKSLLLAFMLMIAANLFAQQQIATLNHNDTISVFYGNYALRDAHEAAVDGDIVTLSSGTFTIISADLYKNITINGNGCVYDTINCSLPTIITSDHETVYLGKKADQRYNISFQGIFFNIKNLYLRNDFDIKIEDCYIKNLSIQDTDKNCTNRVKLDITNCIVENIYEYCLTSKMIFDLNIINSSIYKYSGDAANSEIFLRNSLLFLDNHLTINATNSIISRHYRSGSNDYKLKSSSNAYNCIFITRGDNRPIYEGSPNSSNMFVENFSDIFETYHNINNFSFEERYILKEEIATSFLGSDGTEVGIHGGMFPFDTRPFYMVVKKCNVAQKSTIDGKLSVDIEVMVEE